MKVESLRSQVALAAVPWLEQVQSGQWSGDLHYHYEPDKAGGAAIAIDRSAYPLPGFADPVQLESARAQIDGARVVLDRLQAQAGRSRSPANIGMSRGSRARIVSGCGSTSWMRPTWKES